MNNDSKSDLSRPNIDDSTLDQHLESLPRFAPCAGFEDRVMSYVLVPPPQWVRSMQRSLHSLVQTRRFRWIAAGLMTTSTASLVVATTLVLSNFSAVSRVVGSATATVGLPIWRAFAGFFSNSARGVLAFSHPISTSRDAALIVSVAAVGVLVFSSLMLFCLMRPKCFARSE